MRKLCSALVLATVWMLSISGTAAKCASGTVTVHGSVFNLPSAAASAEVAVFLETAKGKTSKTISLSNGEFSVEIPFSTYSSPSWLRGDSCHNVPKFVEVRIVAADKVYVQKRLNFKDSFEEISPHQYRLKKELSLKVD